MFIHISGIATFTAVAPLAASSDALHQTVEWYMEHQTEREEKLKRCDDEMARAADVDCLNAVGANARVRHPALSTTDTSTHNPSAITMQGGN